MRYHPFTDDSLNHRLKFRVHYKSTLMGRLAKMPNTVLLSEDELLTALYPGEIQSLADYARCTTRLKSAVKDVVKNILKAGTSVVLDFPANTISNRAWMNTLITDTSVAHCLHFLDVSDEECKRRLVRRNADANHQFQTSEEQCDQITRFFGPPTEDEGFNVLSQLVARLFDLGLTL